MLAIPNRFEPAVTRVVKLQNRASYEAAFVFGSVARGEATAHSDLDVQVVTTTKNQNIEVLHVTLDGAPVDLSFLSRQQLKSRCEDEVRTNRRPMLCDSIILFDKAGRVSELKARVTREAGIETRRRPQPDEVRYKILYADEKVRRAADADASACMLAMHLSLGDVLKAHYELSRRWWPGSKRAFADLKTWDENCALSLMHFLHAQNLDHKMQGWSALVSRVLSDCQEASVDREPRSFVSRDGLRTVLSIDDAIAGEQKQTWRQQLSLFADELWRGNSPLPLDAKATRV